MERLHRLVLCVLTIAALAASNGAFGETQRARKTGPQWACWYESNDLTVRCVLSRIQVNGTESRAAESEKSVNPRLPAVASQLWGSPERFADKQIRLQLWNVPYEMDFVRELAESVMCGVRADCSVLFDENPDGEAPLRVAALRAGASEAVVIAAAAL